MANFAPAAPAVARMLLNVSSASLFPPHPGSRHLPLQSLAGRPGFAIRDPHHIFPDLRRGFDGADGAPAPDFRLVERSRLVTVVLYN